MNRALLCLFSLILGIVAPTGRANGGISVRVDDAVVFGGREARVNVTIQGSPGSAISFQTRLIQAAGTLAAPLAHLDRNVTLNPAGRAVEEVSLAIPAVREITTCELLVFGAATVGGIAGRLGSAKLTVIPADLWKIAASEWRTLVVFGETETIIPILDAASVPFDPSPGRPAKLRPGPTYLGVLPWGEGARRLLHGQPIGHLVLVITGIRSPDGWVSFESNNGATRSVVALPDAKSMNDAWAQLAITRALRASNASGDFTSPIQEMLQPISQP